MRRREFKAARAVYTPLQVADAALGAIETAEANASRLLQLGIAGVDGYFAPVGPGQVTGVLAQTSQGKSFFLHAWERAAARQLAASGRNEVLFHVSTEELIEEQAYMELGRQTGTQVGALAMGKVGDWGGLRMAAAMMGSIPIYRIGASLEREEVEIGDLYLSNIYRAIQYAVEELHDTRLTVGGIFVDYLQALPPDPEHRAQTEESRRMQVRSDVYRLFDMAKFFRCPVVVGVQAKQNLGGALGPDFLVPGVYDGEETSAIAQRFSRMISLWMPKQTHTVGTTLEHKGIRFRVDNDLMFLRVGKQRGGFPSGQTFPCRMDFVNNAIHHDPSAVVAPYAGPVPADAPNTVVMGAPVGVPA